MNMNFLFFVNTDTFLSSMLQATLWSTRFATRRSCSQALTCWESLSNSTGRPSRPSILSSALPRAPRSRRHHLHRGRHHHRHQQRTILKSSLQLSTATWWTQTCSFEVSFSPLSISAQKGKMLVRFSLFLFGMRYNEEVSWIEGTPF